MPNTLHRREAKTRLRQVRKTPVASTIWVGGDVTRRIAVLPNGTSIKDRRSPSQRDRRSNNK